MHYKICGVGGCNLLLVATFSLKTVWWLLNEQTEQGGDMGRGLACLSRTMAGILIMSGACGSQVSILPLVK